LDVSARIRSPLRSFAMLGLHQPRIMTIRAVRSRAPTVFVGVAVFCQRRFADDLLAKTRRI
jgi:hypothetical protein